MQKPHLVVLTGAGISAESGLSTFRDSDGLWEGHDVYEVASPQGWERRPQTVLDFYNARRKDILKAKPNAAHYGLAEMQNEFRVTVITQNIDDLHERAGSADVIHLHGEIIKMKSCTNDHLRYPYQDDIHWGDLAEDGGQLRPHVVWFGEAVPMIEKAATVVQQADVMAVVGTSLVVYPAAGLVSLLKADTPLYILDKKIPDLPAGLSICPIEKPATEAVEILRQHLTTHHQ